jgi:DNA-binding MarR family transcriptional regulator
MPAPRNSLTGRRSHVRADARPTSLKRVNEPVQPDAAHFAVWADFVLAHTRIMRRIEDVLRSEIGISWAQYDLLYNLNAADGGRLSIGAVSQSLLYSSGSASNLVASMVAAQLVDRERSEADRRSFLISATPEGRARFTTATTLVLEIVARDFTSRIADDELLPVSQFLARLRTADDGLRRPPYDLPARG